MAEEGQTGADRKRGKWNRLLVKRAVAHANAILIESLTTSLDDDRTADLYALWPQQCPINPIDELPEHIARELAARPVIRCASEPRWCSFDDVTHSTRNGVSSRSRLFANASRSPSLRCLSIW